MKKYTVKDKRAVNFLSLLFLGLGSFFIAASLFQWYKVSTAGGFDHLDGFFIARCIIGGVFVLCAVTLHMLIEKAEFDLMTELNLAIPEDSEPEPESAPVSTEQPSSTPLEAANVA